MLSLAPTDEMPGRAPPSPTHLAAPSLDHPASVLLASPYFLLPLSLLPSVVTTLSRTLSTPASFSHLPTLRFSSPYQLSSKSVPGWTLSIISQAIYRHLSLQSTSIQSRCPYPATAYRLFRAVPDLNQDTSQPPTRRM